VKRRPGYGLATARIRTWRPIEAIVAGTVQRVGNLFEIVLTPPPKGSRQSAESIYAQLRAAILDGRLVAAAKLPVERQSALFFGVSRNTAARAYAKLALEGLVESRRGSGTYE
jgi:GntR family transcriptional regulator/MocR family aminotransferase